jgi:hypothetical protein
MKLCNKFNQLIVDKQGLPFFGDIRNVSLNKQGTVKGVCDLTGQRVITNSKMKVWDYA